MKLTWEHKAYHVDTVFGSVNDKTISEITIKLLDKKVETTQKIKE